MRAWLAVPFALLLGAQAHAVELKDLLDGTAPEALSEETAPAADDTFLILDTSEGVIKRLQKSNLSVDALDAGALDDIGEVDAALRSGSDTLFITGTAGTSGNLAEWNVDGDLVDSSVASSSILQNVVDDTTPQLGGDLDLNGNSLDFPSTLNISDTLDEDNMASDCATCLATQQSIKAYVDGAASGITEVVQDTSPQLGGQLDVNGFTFGDGTNELMTFVEDASAVNQVEVENEATGSGPIIRSTGDDANVDLNLETKGAGTINLNDGIVISDELAHNGDTNNKIAFGTDTQDFQTGGSSRLDISDSGVRLGGANARVTAVLDEDTMSSDSATSLATQQSIKAYVDDNTGSDFTWLSETTGGGAASIDVTGIGAANEVVVVFDQVNVDADDFFLVQLGDAGGVETTGYVGSSSDQTNSSTSTSGFAVRRGASNVTGVMTLHNPTGNLWVQTHGTDRGAGGGSKTLSATLDRIRLQRDSSGNFQSGTVYVGYR